MGAPVTVDPFDQARAEAMLRGYDARWGGEQYEVIGVELEFHTELINPATGAASRTWRLGGKLDVLARDLTDGATVLLEHKTSTEDISPGSSYLKRLRLDGQISTYYAGAAALGHRIDKCLYDVLVKPGLHPYRATPDESRKYTKDGRLYANQRLCDETPTEYRNRLIETIATDPNGHYVRWEVVRLESEMEDAAYDTWQLGQQIQEARRLGRAPRNPDACVRWNRTCEFFGVCTGEASLDDPHAFRRSESVHRELEHATNDTLSNSRLSCARACQRLHKLKYLDGYRPAQEADTLRFGTLIHRGLEAWWKASGEERLPAAMEAIHPQESSTEVQAHQ